MKKTTAIMLLVLVALIMSMLVIPIRGISASGQGGTDTAKAGASYTSHDPIHIDGNTAFAENASIEGWAGDGTEGNPYIIENYDIDASSAIGIYIRNTDVYFIIRNCAIHDGKTNYDFGIYSYNVTYGKVDNVTSYNNYYGIFLSSSSNNQITSCTAYNNYKYGIYLGHSSNNRITNCTVYNNNYNGICLYYSSNNNTITLNHVYKNIRGIDITSSSNNTMTLNQICDNSYGIWLKKSSNSEIHYNNIYNNTDYGIYNTNLESEFVANATYNWWGSASGPHHPISNIGGTGNRVADNVVYNPWLTEPVEGEEGKLFEIPWLYIIIPVIFIIVLIITGLGVKRNKKQKLTVVKCPKCGETIQVVSAERPLSIVCPKCGTRGTVK